MRYAKKKSLNILPGKIKQIRQYAWYDYSFRKNIWDHSLWRTNKNVNSDCLWVVKSGWPFYFFFFTLIHMVYIVYKMYIVFIIQDNKFYFNKETCWVRANNVCWYIGNIGSPLRSCKSKWRLRGRTEAGKEHWQACGLERQHLLDKSRAGK